MSKPDIKRIAMWSGPRNLSTAMMRAWENRADTFVVDEPFYACFLTASTVRHPMHDEVLASQPHSWSEVIKQNLQGSSPKAETIQFQKHMTQHMLGEIDADWFATLEHAFLIRDPAEVVASYSEKRELVTAQDIGYAKQMELYQQALKLGATAPVIDAADVLRNPEKSLSLLCEKLAVDFDKNMLEWPAGGRDSDGVWASHWYNSVKLSTRFAPYRKKIVTLNTQEKAVVDECMPIYETLYEQRLR